MSEPTGERLYNLLPAVYRLRDVAQGEPLRRALLGVIERELDVVERDIEGLYDNWFIETCDEWVVPYLGDLLGVRGLLPADPGGSRRGAFSQRALVANTLAYRPAKGTAAVLEQLARDISGWPAKVVEFFTVLSTTQYAKHLRMVPPGTVDLRDTNRLELLNGPFERAAHTAEVRHIDKSRGKYNIGNVGLFLWRLQSYFVLNSTARPVTTPADGRYRFNPLGLDVPLFNRPHTESQLAQTTHEENIAGALRRRPLHEELEVRRQTLVNENPPSGLYFGAASIFEVFVQDTADTLPQQVPPAQILICDLSDPVQPAPPPANWRRPPTYKTYIKTTGDQPVEVAWPIQVAVDPVNGRLAFPPDRIPFKVLVSYAYGFSGDLGGGPYNRQASAAMWFAALGGPVTWQIGVTRIPDTLNDPLADRSQLAASLSQAILAWNAYVVDALKTRKADDPYPFGVIALTDSDTYDTIPPADLPAIQIAENSKLVIIAADWPVVNMPSEKHPHMRRPGQFVPNGVRPHIAGNLTVQGTALVDSINHGALVLDGLLIEGSVTVTKGNLGSLRLAHCTLVPGKGGLTVASENPLLAVSLERTISGPISLPDNSVPKLSLLDCIVDGNGGMAIRAEVAATDISASTILGQTSVSLLQASNSLFTGVVRVTRRQLGCVRFSYLPLGSQSPRRYRVQPASFDAGRRVSPQFTSLTYGQPGYAQLAPACPSEISTGAEDEGEMGAFHFLQQAQRLQNLRTSLEEYLRFGLEAGLFFIN